jgi:hypothetical protein
MKAKQPKKEGDRAESFATLLDKVGSRLGYYVMSKTGRTRRVKLMAWSKWFEKNYLKRQIARDEFPGGVVSTVFLGIDHGFGGPPQLFETMIFTHKKKAPLNNYSRRYSTIEQARKGHAVVVAMTSIGLSTK